MAISTIGTDALASAAVTSAKLASGAPSRSQLPAGTVLQVVQATNATTVNTSSTSFVTTNASISITPSSASSKVLVMFIGGQIDTGTTGRQLQLDIYRGSTQLSGTGATGRGLAQYYSSSGELQSAISIAYLDSPATTSSTAYTLYLSSSAANQVGVLTNGNPLVMIAMEIAA